jgi:hypothetical protein
MWKKGIYTKTNADFLPCLTQFFLEWGMFQANLAQKLKKHTFCIQELFFENRSVYEIMWKNIVEPDRTQMTIWRTRITCWIPKAPDAHSEYVIPTVFQCNNGCTKASQCYVIRTLPLLITGRTSKFSEVCFHVTWEVVVGVLGGASSVLFLELISRWRQKSPLKRR